MNNELQSKQQNTELPVRKTCAIVERILNENIGPFDDNMSRQELNDVLNRFFNQKVHSGDADDFHNFAVTLAFRDEYSLACNVLEVGLKYFPRNVDLLADFLQYGLSCNEYAACEEKYKTLLSIPQRLWTWRGFSFLIYYLLKTKKDTIASDTEFDTLVNELTAISKAYRNIFNKSEDGYHIEAIVYRELNMRDAQKQILETAIQQPITCPKCSIMLADINFEDGDYQSALSNVKKAITDSNFSQRKIHDGYLYFMSALCKIASAQKDDCELNKDTIAEILCDFNIALSFFEDTDENYRDIIKRKMIYLLSKYHVCIPSEYDELFHFVEEIKNN